MTNRRAWVDESESNRSRDPGTYILSAAVGSVDQEDDARKLMTSLLLPGQTKLHWRDERKRHIQLVEAVEACGMEHMVLVRTAVDERTERRRRKCMEGLLREVHSRWSVTDVVLESRGPADDQRDIDFINRLRGSQRLDPHVRVRHATGREEPMLWIPDTVCGMVSAERIAHKRYLAAFGDQVTIIQI